MDSHLTLNFPIFQLSVSSAVGVEIHIRHDHIFYNCDHSKWMFSLNMNYPGILVENKYVSQYFFGNVHKSQRISNLIVYYLLTIFSHQISKTETSPIISPPDNVIISSRWFAAEIHSLILTITFYQRPWVNEQIDFKTSTNERRVKTEQKQTVKVPQKAYIKSGKRGLFLVNQAKILYTKDKAAYLIIKSFIFCRRLFIQRFLVLLYVKSINLKDARYVTEIHFL